jgi:hypothetical protein
VVYHIHVPRRLAVPGLVKGMNVPKGNSCNATFGTSFAFTESLVG